MGSTFEGLHSSEILDDFFSIKGDGGCYETVAKRNICLSRRARKSRVGFLSMRTCHYFVLIMEKMGHRVRDYDLQLKGNPMEEEDMPYSNALKAESTQMGKEWVKFGPSSRSVTFVQRSYLGEEVVYDGDPANLESVVGGAVAPSLVPVSGDLEGNGLTSTVLETPKILDNRNDSRADLGDLSHANLGDFLGCDMLQRAYLNFRGNSLNNNVLDINMPPSTVVVKQSTWVRIQRADINEKLDSGSSLGKRKCGPLELDGCSLVGSQEKKLKPANFFVDSTVVLEDVLAGSKGESPFSNISAATRGYVDRGK